MTYRYPFPLLPFFRRTICIAPVSHQNAQPCHAQGGASACERTLQCSQRFLIELCTFIPRICCWSATTANDLATGLIATEKACFGAMLEKRVRAWGTSVCGRRETGVAMVGRDADEER